MTDRAASTGTTGGRAAGSPRSRRKTFIIAAQLVLGAVIVAFIARGFWLSPEGEAPPSTPVPQQIAGLSLTRAVTGQNAVTELRRMHGKDVGIFGGWIAYYQNRAIVWVGETPGEAQAYQLIDAMTRRIRAGSPEFTDLQQLRFGSQTVYGVVGQGQRHYYWQQGALTVWIAAPNVGETEFLRESLRLIK